MGNDSESNSKMLAKLENAIAQYPDFPKKGILFRDIMPILLDHKLYEGLIDQLCSKVSHLELDRILGIESRGFLLGPMMAIKRNVPFVPIRKKGKLPGEVLSVEYELEYGKDCLQAQTSSIPKGCRCLIVDDLIATGGSLAAARNLVEMSGAEVVAFVTVIELSALEGRKKLGETPVFRLFAY